MTPEAPEIEAVRVDVYFNLHRRVWSVRDRRTGLVARHARVVAFPHGARFVVNESGRQRVIQTRRKNVHAFVRGERPEVEDSAKVWAEFLERLEGGALVTYNPYRAGHFYRRDTGEAIAEAACVVMLAEAGEPPRVWAVP